MNRFRSGQALQQAERELEQMLRSRGIYFGDGLLPTYPFAYFAPQEQIAGWARRAEQFVAAAEGLTVRLLENEEFFRAMGLSPEALELVRIKTGNRRHCEICRPDGIPVGNSIEFVELNCDSPAMMMFLDEVARCLLELDALAPLRDRVRVPTAADQLLETLTDSYRAHSGAGTPTIAITDWEGQKTRFEHMRLAEHFEARGYPTMVCDPREFRTVDGKLEARGRQIQLVYRRVLASEVIERRSEIEPLLAAYRDGTICMVNPLSSYVVSAKSVLSWISADPDLSTGLRDLLPPTVLLDNDEARERVRSAPERWVLKRSEGHGGMHVLLPGVATEKQLLDALELSKQETWVAQEFREVPQLALPSTDGDAVVWGDKYYNWNPFVFGGRYAGGLVRVSSTPLINITLGGGLIPTLAEG